MTRANMCQPEDRPAETRGWLLLPAGSVPERWRSRDVTMSLVPLLPREIGSVLAGEAAEPSPDPVEERMVELAARGRSLRSIASEVGLSLRAVQQRFSGLRRRYGVGTTAELRALFAEQGLGLLRQRGNGDSQGSGEDAEKG